jgi:hypothetical protein
MFIYGCLDLHPNNIGVALPELEAFSERMIWEQALKPDISPLVAYDPERDLVSFPPYLCGTLDVRQLLCRSVRYATNFAARAHP